MSSENYANYYVEALIKMMNDAHLKIVGHQTTIRLNEEAIQGFQAHIQSLNSKDVDYEKSIVDLNTRLTDALNKSQDSANKLAQAERELSAVRTEMQHLETFKSQLTTNP